MVPNRPDWLSLRIIEDLQLVTLDFNVTYDSQRIVNFLAQNAKGLVSLSNYGNIGKVLQLTRSVGNHATLYVDKKAPELAT